MPIPIYEAVISSENEGLLKISLVDSPAVLTKWQAFKNEEKPSLIKMKIENEDEHILTGVVMRCSWPIYRYSEEIGEYYIVYDKETIQLMCEKMLADNTQNNINLNHEDGTDTDKVKMLQVFIKDTEKGINPEGFEDIEDFSMFASFKVYDEDLWQAIKDGDYSGFSLEGYFSLIETGAALQYKKENNKVKNTDKMSKVKKILKSLLAEFGSIDTNNGTLDYEGELEVGTAVKINDEVAPDGEYETDDKVIVIADGVVTEIRDKDEVIEEEPAAFSKFKKVAQAYSETYSEKESKIYDAIKSATGVEYFWLCEAADDYAVYSIWVDDKDKYFRVELTWDEEGNVIVGEISEVEPAFVEKKEDEPATEVVEMAEETPAEEGDEPKTDEEPAERDLAAEIDAIKADIEAIKTAIADLKEKPANEPIAEQFEAISTPDKTGSRGMDKALKRFAYLNKK